MRFAAVLIVVCCAPIYCATQCEKLSQMSLLQTKITAAEEIGPLHAPALSARFQAPPLETCRIAASLAPTTDSDIKIELWMPKETWNGKYLAVGNGGWSGSINYNGLLDGVRRGYATSSTDTGHTGGSASFAVGHPEKLIDYAYRSEHEMVVAAKAIATAYYEKRPKLSYWNGCSAGGKQGLKEAQVYPADFDGIVAGAPAGNWTGRAAQAIWSAQAVHKEKASFIPAAKYLYIHKAVLEACDASDGLKDGVIENPAKCQFDPKVLECGAEDNSQCLTPPQVEAARKLYSDSVNPQSGKHLYSGLQKGSELGWATWAGQQPLGIALDYFRYIVFQKEDWDFRTLNFDVDVARAERLDAHRINATDPNLKPFFDRGSKLIQYHGWSDPQISPGNSVAYFQSVTEKLGPGVPNSYRLFMVPGMGHCGGGEGTDSFDMVRALEDWVEARKAPVRVIASRIRNEKLERTRPLCPYPEVAVYKGSGDPNNESNFNCAQ